jgi:hypothetical protein
MASLTLLAVIAASTGAMTLVVMAHAQRVSHQRDGLQALYLAEMGVEELLAQGMGSERSAFLTRTVRREASLDGPHVAAPDTAGGALEALGDPRPVVGSYEVRAERKDGSLRVMSQGRAVDPAGKAVSREVHVTCRWTGGRWAVQRWEQVP